jgi:hypothetical protein
MLTLSASNELPIAANLCELGSFIRICDCTH